MRSFLRFLILMFAATVLGDATAADQEDLGDLFLFTKVIAKDEITLKQWQEMRTETLAKPGIERQELASQLVVNSAAERKIYRFTQPGHPAHPAVVVLSSIGRGIGAEIQRSGYYAGDKKAFDAWWQEFDHLNGIR
jgi:hypothetical protein